MHAVHGHGERRLDNHQQPQHHTAGGLLGGHAV
ncbi:hypothetical protein J2X67_005378 [Variovorax sp. 3319]|nr:hypothetical protein [Variovorax sp. 3319]